MRVKVLEESLKDSGYDLTKDDTITVSDELGQYWCDHGWAEDTSGAYETGERKVEGTSLVSPKKGIHVAGSTKPVTRRKVVKKGAKRNG
jgi:hypothetical protein